MATVNGYILYCETRNESERNDCHLAFFMQKVGEGFSEKGATLAQNYVSQAASSNRLLGKHFIDRISCTGKKAYPTRGVKFVQRNLRILLEKENEKKLCGDIHIVKCHSGCQSTSNCTTQSQTICKYRRCVLCRFFSVNFHCFFSEFLFAST
jgi:hypothetical protein